MQRPLSIYEEFNTLSNQLSSLAYLKSNHNKALLYKLLRQFNELPFGENSSIANEKAVLVLNQCCFLIPDNSDNQSALLLLNLFINFLSKLKISIEGKTLDVSTEWILKCILTGGLQQTKLALLALQELVRGRTVFIDDNKVERIFDVCHKLTSDVLNEEVDPEIYLNSLRCLESLCYFSEGDSPVPRDLIVKCIPKFLKVLYEKGLKKDSQCHSHCLIVSLRALGNMVTNRVPAVFDFLPDLFGIFKNYTSFGLNEKVDNPVTKVKPSNIVFPLERQESHQHHHSRSRGKYEKKSKKKVPTPISQMTAEGSNEEESLVGSTWSSYMAMSNPVGAETFHGNYSYLSHTSESEYSDSDGASHNTNANVSRTSAKVRRCTISLLGSILLEGDQKVLIQYLPSLLPNDSKSSQDITVCIKQDPSAACRSEMILVLSIMFRKFKNYFQLANGISQSSFTSLSNVIAESIIKLHECLTHVLYIENYKAVIIQTLKSISDLIRCTPYHKLNENGAGLLTAVARRVIPFLDNPDINVQITAFVVFGCIVSVVPKVDDSKSVAWGKWIAEHNLNTRPWLLDKCLNVLVGKKGINEKQRALALECLQVVAALVRNYPQQILIPFQVELGTIMQLSSNSNYDFMIRLYTGKLLESIATSLQASSTDENESIAVTAAARVWETLILPSVTSLLTCENEPPLKAIACNCLAYLAAPPSATDPSIIYNQLIRQSQILCITHVFGYINDDDSGVRSSSIRALAVFVKFGNLRDDPLFLADAIDAFFKAAHDSNCNVLFQASWLFSHLADSILLNNKDGSAEPLTDDLLIRLIKTGITLIQDSKKGKPYSVRGLAVFMSLGSEEFVEGQAMLVKEAMGSLVTSASTGNTVKGRWNSCYAIGTALSNRRICLETRCIAFPLLFQLVTSHKNFKVRIGAAHALSSPVDKFAYDEYYLATWKILLTSLDNCQTSIADVNEYQHSEQLIDTICAGLCHLLSLADLTDFVSFYTLTSPYSELLEIQFNRFQTRIVPEKACSLLAASANLATFTNAAFYDVHHKNAYSFISQLFAVNDSYMNMNGFST